MSKINKPTELKGRAKWEADFSKTKIPPGKKFMTVSSRQLKPLYDPGDVDGIDYDRDLGYPGQYPYTRGVHASKIGRAHV